jgi:hypothetical protein
MTEKSSEHRHFPTAENDLVDGTIPAVSLQAESPSFRLSYDDREFLLRDELRSVRLQLELLKPELIQQERGIHSTVVVFGSARVPEPQFAAQQRQDAEQALGEHPDDPKLQRGL